MLRRTLGRAGVRACKRWVSSSAPACLGLRFDTLRDGNVLQLPRLPVPELDATLDRYLRSIEALTGGPGSAEFEEHSALVRDFGATAGPALHEALVARDAADADRGDYPYSYIEADWDDMYFAGRWALPINSNPYFILGELPGASNDAGRYDGVARFASACVLWHTRLLSDGDDGGLPEEEAGGGCVSQVPLQFGTGRVAREERCVLGSDPHATHGAVLCNGRFYTVPLLLDGGAPLAPRALAAQLEAIKEDSETRGPGEGLGALTTQGRDEWGRQRLDLERSSPRNALALRLIDTALCLIVLDEHEPTVGSSSMSNAAALLLHGSVEAGGRDRWYDKHQIIAFADGSLGINFEHSFSDGMSWNHWIAQAWGHLDNSSPIPSLPEAHADGTVPPLFEPLEWELDSIRVQRAGAEGGGAESGAVSSDGVVVHSGSNSAAGFHSVAEAVAAAAEAFSADAAGLQTHVLEFNSFGKSLIKTWGVSPDSAAQMAFQLAFFRMHGEVPPTYESCSTRAFLHGRTETIRSATPAAAEFGREATALWDQCGDENPDVATATRVCELFRAATAAHIETAKAATKGHGVDRHLTALESVAQRMPVFAHPIFEDPLFKRSRAWRISSSNVTAPFLSLFGFGPVVGNGYGLGYMVQNDSIPVSITAFSGSGIDTNAEQMADAIAGALQFLRRCHEAKSQ